MSPAVLPTALEAQSSSRIWGEVTTADGDELEGFIRWDRNEGGWADILDGSKEIPEDSYAMWLDARRGGERPTRRIDLMGYRVTWDEDDPDFPSLVTSGIRFGHIAALENVGDDAALLTLKSGERIELTGGSSDIGWGMRELLVEEPQGGTTELDWEELDRVVFGPAPAGVRPESPRLFGTVADAAGRSFTGYISWDLDEIYGDDILDGEDEDQDDHEVPFSDIRTIERTEDGALVTLRSGEAMELSGTNDVDRGHRGVQISDPELGMVEVRWREFVAVTFTELPDGNGYGTYSGGHRLLGTVTTSSGEVFNGHIRWDADELWSWELLNGDSEGVSFDIELGKVAHIRRVDESSAVVTLLDGRTFALEGSNDVDEDNKGIFVELVDPEGDGLPWRYVGWEEFQELRFRHPADATTEADAFGGGR